jgi:N-acetylneuraminic acid mutarotase
MLVDFGIARYFKDGQSNDTTDFGSPGYASPEQYQGEGQTDARSDLFSLGVLLHEMLTGQHPGGLGGRLDTVQHLNPTVSAVLSGLVTLATRSDPLYRFQSAYTFYTALDRAYFIEEQRTYQRNLQKTDTITRVSSSSTNVVPNRQYTQMMPAADKVEQNRVESRISSTQAGIMTIEQRQHTRIALQQAHQERMEQEQLEHQLAFVDESLKIRTSVPFSYEPQPFEEALVEETSAPQPVASPSRKLRRIIQTSFLIALLLFSVMASLLLYARVAHHDNKLIKGQHIVITQHTATIQSIWNILPSLSSPQADNTVSYVQLQGRSYIYMSGGYRGAKNSPHYDRHLYRYDILAAHWEQVPSEHFPGMVNNAVTQDEQGRLFFTVGYSTDAYAVTSLLYQYQPATGTLSKITPPPQVSIGFGAALIADQQGHLYMTQGFQKSGDPHAQAGIGWYRYDIATNQWHTLAPLPRGLGYVVLANDGSGNIILLGGATDAGQHLQTDAMYRYNITQNSWADTQTKAPSALSGVASCSPKSGQIVLIGGYDATHDTGLAQTWLIDLHKLSWTALTGIPTGGSVLGAAACDGQGHVFLVRGASDPNTPTQDFLQMSIQQ